jgi:uncharacterized phiE125 gp8 family phage protein
MRTWLRLDDEAEDGLVSALIGAARLLVEAASGRILVEQRWRLVLDRWPRSRIVAPPFAPLIAVEAVRVDRGGGDPLVEGVRLLGQDRLLVDPSVPDPLPAREGIEIDLGAGYGGPEDVPPPLVQAIRILVARWFENRGEAQVALPADLGPLILPFRRPRL